MEEEKFYIQNGYVGNAVYWWAMNSRGYTTDIERAHKYTKEEALDIIRNDSRDDRAWPCEYIDNHNEARQTIINSQYLDQYYLLT